ncbi:hypothetical protein PMAYCL1PPCAC_17882, partial [Pristionchus mayeri]
TFSPCTNSCMAPNPGDVGVPTSLSVVNNDKYMILMMKALPLEIGGKKYTLSPDKSTITVKCAKSGETFSNNPSSSSMTLVCDASTGQYSDESTGKVVYPTKTLPPCGTDSNPPPS